MEERKRPPGKREVKIAFGKATLFVKLGDGAAQLTDGYGGVETVERPKNKPITRWAGQPPLRMDLPLMVDNYGHPQGVERELHRILALGRKDDGTKEPPVFRVTGAVPLSGAKWKLEDMPDMGEAAYEDGRLKRQFLTLHLVEPEAADTAKFKRRGGNGDGDGGAGGHDRYTVKQGDTLRKIAAKLKPDASNEDQRAYAKAIGKLNDIRDLRRELIPGVVLRLP